MGMSRAQKTAEVEEIRGQLESSELVVVAHNEGLSVAQMSALRAKLREGGARYKVTKNTLTRLAIKDTPYEGIVNLFRGPTGIATSQDPVAAAKIAHDFAKDNEKFVILGGALGATVLDAKGVEALAKLPSLDEIRGKLVGLLVAPATKLARVLQTPAQQMVGVTKAYGEKGE